MLEIRPSCENFNKSLPIDSDEAMICTFECTFCAGCVDDILLKVCSNYGGNFAKRPIRSNQLLEKYPVSQKVVHEPVDVEAYLKRIQDR